MKYLILLLALFGSTAQANFAPVDLIAGQNTVVGSVVGIYNETTGMLDVTYSVEPQWCITGVHTAAALTAAGLPVNKADNPKVGNFEVSEEPIPFCETTKTVSVTVPENCADKYVVAAHAVVQIPALDELIDALALIDGSINQSTAGSGYFQTTVSNIPGLDGVHQGWCVDALHYITPGTTYSCKFYGSGDDYFPPELMDKPEFLGSVVWLFNQDYAGTASPTCNSNYNDNDIQQAIWNLIDDRATVNSCRIDELTTAALANVDYVPGSGDILGVICGIVDENGIYRAKQTTIIEFPFPEDETAWAFGNTFNDNNWAMYTEATCPVTPQ